MQVIGLKGGDQGEDHNWIGEERKCVSKPYATKMEFIT